MDKKQYTRLKQLNDNVVLIKPPYYSTMKYISLIVLVVSLLSSLIQVWVLNENRLNSSTMKDVELFQQQKIGLFLSISLVVWSFVMTLLLFRGSDEWKNLLISFTIMLMAVIVINIINIVHLDIISVLK